jgi:tetratricopeptide (TPR) repeat protein
VSEASFSHVVGHRLITIGLDLLHRLHRFGVASEANLKREAAPSLERATSDVEHTIEAGALRERERWIREKLRRYPFWLRGHEALAKIALRRDDIALAYASASAMLKLQPGGDSAHTAFAVLGRAYLRRGEGKRAIEMFERCLSKDSANPALREDLAAAHLLVSDFAAAVNALEGIPEELRSGEARAALAFARRRRDGETV